MNSSRENIKTLPSSTTRTLNWKNNHIKRAHSLLYTSLNIDQDLNRFNSNSQTNFSSKTPLNTPCLKRHQSFQNLQTDSMAEMNVNQDFDQTRNFILTSDDEDDQEILSNIKSYIDQANQTVLQEQKKLKKKPKKSKSRTKQINGVQIPPSTLSIASPNRINSNGDSSSPIRTTTSMGKLEDNNGVKSIITVDISKARSNLEVVRLCIRELGWKEV